MRLAGFFRSPHRDIAVHLLRQTEIFGVHPTVRFEHFPADNPNFPACRQSAQPQAQKSGYILADIQHRRPFFPVKQSGGERRDLPDRRSELRHQPAGELLIRLRTHRIAVKGIGAFLRCRRVKFSHLKVGIPQRAGSGLPLTVRCHRAPPAVSILHPQFTKQLERDIPIVFIVKKDKPPIPPFTQTGVQTVFPLTEPFGHVIGLVRDTPAVIGPAGIKPGVMQAPAIELQLIYPQRRSIQHGPPHLALHRKASPEIRRAVTGIMRIDRRGADVRIIQPYPVGRKRFRHRIKRDAGGVLCAAAVGCSDQQAVTRAG